MTIFVDTSAFLAVLNRGDRFHQEAAELWQDLMNQGERLICNNYVIVETTALLQRRFGLEAVRALEEDAMRRLVVIWLDETDHRQAITALLAANRRQLSLVDCSAMTTMRTLGIRHVFSFDAHFDDYGFERLP